MEQKKAFEIFSTGFAKFVNRNKLELKDVAAWFSIDSASVSKWRSGKNLPQLDKVFTLIEHGMAIDEIFGEELAAKLCPKVTPAMFADMEPMESAKLVQQGLLQILEKLNSGKA